MDQNLQADVRGRIIVQAMYSELEKIAYSQAAQTLGRKARDAAQHHARVSKAAGWRKWLPFSSDHRAADAARRRARNLSGAADSQVKAERKAAFETIRTGKGNRDSALRVLENKPRKVRPDANPEWGIKAPDIQSSRPKEGGGLSRTAKGLIGGAAGVGAVAGGAVLGKRYIDSKQSQSGPVY